MGKSSRCASRNRLLCARQGLSAAAGNLRLILIVFRPSLVLVLHLDVYTVSYLLLKWRKARVIYPSEPPTAFPIGRTHTNTKNNPDSIITVEPQPGRLVPFRSYSYTVHVTIPFQIVSTPPLLAVMYLTPL